MKNLYVFFTWSDTHSPKILKNFCASDTLEQFLFISDSTDAKPVSRLSDLFWKDKKDMVLVFRDKQNLTGKQLDVFKNISKAKSLKVNLGYHQGRGTTKNIPFIKNNIPAIESLLKIESKHFFSRHHKIQEDLEKILSIKKNKAAFQSSIKEIATFFDSKKKLEQSLTALHQLYFLPKSKKNKDLVYEIVLDYASNIGVGILSDHVLNAVSAYSPENHQAWLLDFRETILEQFKKQERK